MSSFNRIAIITLLFPFPVILPFWPAVTQANYCTAQPTIPDEEPLGISGQCAGMALIAIPRDDLLPEPPSPPLAGTLPEPLLELSCSHSSLLVSPVCSGIAIVPASPSIDVGSSSAAPNAHPATSLGNDQADHLAAQNKIRDYLMKILYAMVAATDSLPNAKDYKPYFGSPRVSESALGDYTSIAVVLPSEVVDSEERGAWVAFDISFYREARALDGDEVYLIVVDKSRAARRSYFGAEKNAPSPSQVYSSNDATFSHIEDTDKRIAQKLTDFFHHVEAMPNP